LVCAATLLASCGREEARKKADEAKAKKVATELSVATEVPEEQGGVEGATPMKNRVATLGLLNKRNGLVRDVVIKPGEAIRIGKAIVRLRACERTASWELAAETGAFVQLIVQGNDSKWRGVFSGWVFKERPERNIIQHPIYDVFVKSCTMAYPGDPAPAPVKPAAAAADGSANSASSAPKTGAAAPVAPTPPAVGASTDNRPAPKAPSPAAAKAASPAPKSAPKAN
jgi:hypothetical protein